ncbi:MAG: peptidoglycan-binding protein [Devosia sp.]
MVRAHPQYDQQADTGEWQDLRSELVALLDQVESQVARAHQPDPAYQGLTERMRDLRHQVTEIEPETRHREALRSVQRAVSRFSDRDEAPMAQTTPNPRDTLESAIQQIRSRHFAPPPAAAPPLQREPAPRPPESPRFDELAEAVGGISSRLERLEGELRSQARGQTANVKEIADQVGQLSQVVELLAGAVGETGQVKRLEGQIAGLAKLVSREPQVDVAALTHRLDDVSQTVAKLAELQKAYADRSDTSGLSQRLDDVTATVGRLADLQVKLVDKTDNSALTRRLDDVTATVGKLADLQVQLVDKTDNTGLTRRLDDVTATVGRLADLQVQVANRVEHPRDGLKDAMKAIEEGVRSIYDRVDAIERQMAMPPAELEKITDELQRFAALMKAPQQPQGLIELVDALNQRISDIEVHGPAATAFRADLDAMRSAVADAVEPRFAALEQQLEAISDRVANPPELNIGQLEAQVRQLVARMDQTGEQLTGLARLYSQPAEREPAPDYAALAEMVAERTSAAIADRDTTRTSLGEPEYAELEKRLGQVMERIAADRPADDHSALEATIREVNDRLARLEQAVAKPAPLPLAGTPAFPAETAIAKEREPEAGPVTPLLRTIEPEELANESVIDVEPDAPVAAASEPPRADAMPANPAEDAPLYDQPFGDANPLQRALEAKNGPRRRHSALAAEVAAELPPPPIPSFDLDEPEPAPFEPAADQRPLPPTSSLDSDPLPPRPELRAADESAAITSRNTFIAAARRAAMRQSSSPAPAAGAVAGTSLIARAFARFQASRTAEPQADATPVEAVPPVVPESGDAAQRKPKAPKLKLGRRQLAGDAEPTVAWQPEGAEPGEPAAEPEPETAAAIDDGRPEPAEAAPRPGLITRYRTVILAAITALAMVALANLLVQRSQQEPAPDAAANDATTIGDATLSPTPLAQQLDLPTVPATPARVIAMTDSLQTASVDPAAANGFTAIGQQPMPPAVAAANDAAAADVTQVAALSDSLEPLAPNALASPVKVDLPPPGVAPDALRQAAADGDARAQFEVAAIYTEGRAVPEDLNAAAVWYERAASQGFAPAQYRLGNLYEAGKGVDKDLAQARIWYQQAAEAGNRMAMHNLAALYAGGGLGTQQFDAAAKWFEEAANRGMKDSQFNLGMLYARGLGVKQDLPASFKWFALAAARGDADAAKARDDIAKSLDAATVQRLDDEVGAWQPVPVDLAANFAPIGTWMQDFDPGAPIGKLEVVKGVQQALRRLGFDVGTPDGLAGPKTADAIRAFERGTGMNETGTINPRLLAVLGSQPV